MTSIEYQATTAGAARRASAVEGFFLGDGGAVTVDWTVMAATVVAVGLSVMTLVSGGAGDLAGDTAAAMTEDDIVYRSGHFGQNRADVIAGMEWTAYNSGNHARNHFNNIVANLTDAQLRNRHRNWVNIANDPDHPNHALGADRATVFGMALDERGLEPHDGY
jgi:hypothetical protein